MRRAVGRGRGGSLTRKEGGREGRKERVDEGEVEAICLNSPFPPSLPPPPLTLRGVDLIGHQIDLERGSHLSRKERREEGGRDGGAYKVWSPKTHLPGMNIKRENFFPFPSISSSAQPTHPPARLPPAFQVDVVLLPKPRSSRQSHYRTPILSSSLLRLLPLSLFSSNLSSLSCLLFALSVVSWKRWRRRRRRSVQQQECRGGAPKTHRIPGAAARTTTTTRRGKAGWCHWASVWGVCVC